MPSPSRRAFLATLGTLPLAGCTGTALLDSAGSSSSSNPLANRTVYVGGDLTVPGAKTTLTDSLVGADVAVVPAAQSSLADLDAALSAGIPAAVVGADAPRYVQHACAASGRSYALPGQGWTAAARLSALVPTTHGVDVQRFLHTTAPDDLPWALGELLTGAPASPAIPIAAHETGRPLGRARGFAVAPSTAASTGGTPPTVSRTAASP